MANQSLRYRITADAGQFTKEVSKATGKLAKMAAGAATAGAALTAALVKNGLQSADALAKTADKLGVSTEALASLRHAAELTGVQTGKFDVALQRMTRRLADAAAGTGPAVDAFKALGLSADELLKLSPDQAFARIADQMNKVENSSQKVSLAFKLFDSEGVGLVNTLALGSEGLASMASEAETAGIALSRIDARKIELANDAMFRGSQFISGFSQQLAVKFAPVLEGVAERMFGIGKEAGGAATLAGKAFDFMIKAAGFFANAIKGIQVGWVAMQKVFQDVALFIGKGLDDLFRGAVDIYNKLPWVDRVQYESAFDGFVTSMESAVAESQRKLTDLLKEPLPSDAIEDFVAESERAFEAQAIAAGEAQIAIQEGTIKTAEVTEALTKKTTKAVESDWDKAMTAVVERIDGAFAEAWKGSFDSFKDFSKNILGAFKNLLAELAHLAITRPIVMQIGAAFGLGGAAAGALGSGGGGLGAASGAGGLFSTLGGGLAGGIQNLGAALASGADFFGLHGAGDLIANNARGLSTLGGGLGALGAGIGGSLLSKALFKGERATGLGGTLGGTAGAFLGGPLGAGVGAFLGDAVDRLFGGKTGRVRFGVTAGQGGPGIGGQDFTQVGASGLEFGQVTRRLSSEQRTAAEDYFEGFLEIDRRLTVISEALGNQVDLAGKTLSGFSTDSSKTGFFGSENRGEVDSSVLENAPREFVKQWLDATISGFDEALQPFISQIDGTVDEMLTSFSRILEVDQVNTVFEAIGLSLFELNEAGIKAANSFVDSIGGLEQFSAAAESYYQNFFTQAEQAELQTNAVSEAFAELGFIMPETKEAFRGMVEAAQAAGDPTLVANLLNLAPAFANVASAAEAAAEKAASAARAASAAASAAANVPTQTLSQRVSSISGEVARILPALAGSGRQGTPRLLAGGPPSLGGGGGGRKKKSPVKAFEKLDPNDFATRFDFETSQKAANNDTPELKELREINHKLGRMQAETQASAVNSFESSNALKRLERIGLAVRTREGDTVATA